MSEDPLQSDVQYAKGVGPDRAELLRKLDISTIEDLLWHLPRDLLDLTDVRQIPDLEEEELQSVFGEVVDIDGRYTSKGGTLTAVLIENNGAYLRGLWFNQPWIKKRFQHGMKVLLSGKPKFKSGRWEMSHPHHQILEDDVDPNSRLEVLPRYPLTEGIKMEQMRRMLRETTEEYAPLVADPLPESFRQQQQLPALCDALRMLHIPKSTEEYELGKRRLILDDLLEFQLGVALRRRVWKRKPQASALPSSVKIDSRIRKLFSFEFTAGQNRVCKEIAEDLNSEFAMHRLLQADVGAGKTAIALYAMLTCIANDRQTVLMAPTEVLARQHWETVQTLLADSRVEKRLLTGSLKPAAKAQVQEEIRNGTAQLIIGTQAVIQDAVSFKNLGLAVIDEQHKFGVMQRAQFEAGGLSPHVLVMTATPIPRSLCLTQFGDLDLSVMNELPPGRQKVVTSLLTHSPAKKKAWTFLREEVGKGRQCYIVCPRISSEDGGTEVADVETAYQKLTRGPLQGLKLERLHGRMSSEEKMEVMEAFAEREIDVLISTTVIEVGIDIPNATLIGILDAERFGLSQLHQLRGRVSRGLFQGYCFLFTRTDASEALARLNVMTTSTDGFKIAEADFEMRGPGDVLGTRQSGQLPFRVADLSRDRDLLEEARDLAFDLVESGEFDGPEFVPLKNQVLDRFAKLMDLPQSG
ncbi:MAG: ATP-dependent DNA helicase RecG [Planctomycetaceae bacterium]|jgi:ATP-dependent DNA helicase RecG|nr:ATP-dependent DNA helicase RecG [Planctomycetaceae bacterium]MDG2390996.1 ATP-dependent DNA helicase RecG [Planctomycetaceae bacterium]